MDQHGVSSRHAWSVRANKLCREREREENIKQKINKNRKRFPIEYMFIKRKLNSHF